MFSVFLESEILKAVLKIYIFDCLIRSFSKERSGVEDKF